MKFPLLCLNIYFIHRKLCQKKSKWIAEVHMGQVQQQVWKWVHISRLRLILGMGPCHLLRLGLISSTISVTTGRKKFQKGDYFSLILFKLALWVQSLDCEHSQCFTASMEKKMLFAWGLFQQKMSHCVRKQSILIKWITHTQP